MSVKVGGCYAVAEVLNTKAEKGTVLPTSLIGKAVENPIIEDYLRETHNLAATAPLLLATANASDFLDEANDKRPYLEALLRWHPKLPADEIRKLNPTRPDILTHNGPRYTNGVFLGNDRNEYYEIKPDSDTGTTAGKDDLRAVADFYRMLRTKHGLDHKYVPGTSYPKDNSKPTRLALPLNRDFINIASVFLKRHGIGRMSAYIMVRRSQPGLLQYKICMDFEIDKFPIDRVLAAAATKVLYAAYALTTKPALWKVILEFLGDLRLDGQRIPAPKFVWDAVDDLKRLLPALEEAFFMRGIGYPNDEFLIFCDEDFYWDLVSKPPIGTHDIWEQFKKWYEHPVGHVNWGKFDDWVQTADKFGEQFKKKYPYQVQFVDAVINYAVRNPEIVIAVVAAPIIISAAVAIAFEAGLIGAAVMMADGTLTTGSATVVTGLGRTAMTEAVAAEAIGAEVAKSAAARFLTTAEVASQIGGLGNAANAARATVGDVHLLRTALQSPATKNAVVWATGLAASAATLIVGHRSAYAMPKGTRAPNSATTESSVNGPPIAEATSRLIAVRPLRSPRNTIQPLMKGGSFNVYNYAPVAPYDGTTGFAALDETTTSLQMRYLGKVTIS